MGGRRDDDAGLRRPPVALVAGFVLAVLATLAIFFTDNPTHLRLAVIVAASGFLLAAVAAGRRGTDRTALAAREAELRRAFEDELDREESAHREIELRLENDLRREAQESVQYELEGLRRDIAALSSMRGDVRGIAVLREQLAALPALREELSRMSALRAEVAALNALRDDVEALAAMRAEFEQLGELRAEFGRLRAEITEQLSSELLIERIIMRTQATWSAGERPAGGRPAIGEPLDLPATSAMPLLIDPVTDLSAEAEDDVVPRPTSELSALPPERPRPQPFPRYERSLAPHDYARRPAGDDAPNAVTDPLLRPPRPAAPVAQDPAPTGPVYVSEILAGQGTPPPSGRRRRRYRDENTEDDVLSRVLGRD